MQAQNEIAASYGNSNPRSDNPDHVMPHFVLEALNWLNSRLRQNAYEFRAPNDTRQWMSAMIALQYASEECMVRESFHVVFLDSQNKMIHCDEMFRGTLTQVSVYPREIARKALQYGACSVILSHNHPSGKPEPSQADKALTCQVVDALKMLDIRVLDHIIVASGTHTFSFAEHGLI